MGVTFPERSSSLFISSECKSYAIPHHISHRRNAAASPKFLPNLRKKEEGLPKKKNGCRAPLTAAWGTPACVGGESKRMGGIFTPFPSTSQRHTSPLTHSYTMVYKFFASASEARPGIFSGNENYSHCTRSSRVLQPTLKRAQHRSHPAHQWFVHFRRYAMKDFFMDLHVSLF